MNNESSSEALADTSNPNAFPSEPVTYVAWLVLLWLIGTQAFAGWQHSTEGISSYSRSIVDAFAFVIIGGIAMFAFRARKVSGGGISRALSFGFGVIFLAAAFPLCAALGSIWDAVGGTHPDPTGFPKIISEIISLR